MRATRAQLEALSIPQLLTFVANVWRQSEKDCPNCNAPLYALRAASSKLTAYERCPGCEWNFITKDHSRVFDRHADLLLDVAASRVNLAVRPMQRTDVDYQKQPN